MAIYTVGRRRVIFALLLTSALLLTLDIRGNPVLDRIRDGFTRVMSPVEEATDVVTTPIGRAWNGVTNYDDLERENQALQDQVDRLIGTQATARLSVEESAELKALLSLNSLANIPTEVAKVVGASSNNLDQIIEIDKGTSSGFKVGMPVVNQAGLIGRITATTDNSSQVLLITDARYTVPVRVQAAPELVSGPPDTRPSGQTNEELQDLVTTTLPGPTTTLAADVIDTETSLPQNELGATPDAGDDEEIVTDPSAPGDEPVEGELGDEATPGEPPADVPPPTSTTTTTTTEPETPPVKEFGALEGRGRGLIPQVRFLQENPSLAVLQEGDIVVTAGGFDSLAPPDIPIGVVINRADRSGPGGPLLDVQPNADVTKLNFVRVVVYTPLSEVEQ